MNRFSSLGLVILSIASIQFGAAVAKGLFGVLSAEGIAALRLLFAAAILLLVFRPWRQRLEREALKACALYGICLGSMNLLFYLALARIPLGVAVALEFVGPLGVALIFSRKPIDFLWGLLACAGFALLLPIHAFSENLDWPGVLLALAAGVCWGFYILMGAKVVSIVGPKIASAIGMSVAALVVIPFGAFSEGTRLLNLDILPAALGVALLSSAIPYTLEMFALKKIPAKSFGILMSLEPAFATLFGFIYLGEALGAVHLLAIVAVAVASLGSTLS